MTIIELMGKTNEQGKLEFEQPKGLPSQTRVKVTLEILGDKAPNAWENQPLTNEELEALLKTEPKTGVEIAAWLTQEEDTGWDHINMTGEEWVEEQRRKDRERSKW